MATASKEIGRMDLDSRKVFSKLHMTVNVKYLTQSKLRLKLALSMFKLIKYICPCQITITEDKEI